MRIKLTHGYFQADPGIVWFTVSHSLPVLEKELIEFSSQRQT